MSMSMEDSPEFESYPEGARRLYKDFEKLRRELPVMTNERMGVVIPARKAERFMKQNMPFLEDQIIECVANNKISCADVVVVLNRGGDEQDQRFAHDFQPKSMTKLEIWEKGGRFYSDSACVSEVEHKVPDQKSSRLIFIHQQDVEDNSGHGNALRTGFTYFEQQAKTEGESNKYYLTTDTDNRIYAGESNGQWQGNGLLALMEKIESTGKFAVGARVKPAVTDENGVYDPKRKIAGLIQATANLHSEAKGFGWSPGGGTLAKGRDALAGHLAVNTNRLEVPDVSFSVLTSRLAKLDIEVDRTIFVADDAPEQEPISLDKLRQLRVTIKDWAERGGTIQELTRMESIPPSWKKMMRWMQGQKAAEDCFGKDALKVIAQPRMDGIMVGNIIATLRNYGFGVDSISEMVRLVKEIPSYVLIKKTLANKSGDKENVSW